MSFSNRTENVINATALILKKINIVGTDRFNILNYGVSADGVSANTSVVVVDGSGRPNSLSSPFAGDVSIFVQTN